MVDCSGMATLAYHGVSGILLVWLSNSCAPQRPNAQCSPPVPAVTRNTVHHPPPPQVLLHSYSRGAHFRMMNDLINTCAHTCAQCYCWPFKMKYDEGVPHQAPQTQHCKRDVCLGNASLCSSFWIRVWILAQLHYTPNVMAFEMQHRMLPHKPGGYLYGDAESGLCLHRMKAGPESQMRQASGQER